jgi:predicted peptidase
MKLLKIAYQSAATRATRSYFLYLPTGYSSQAGTWPVMLFLHGNGERGDGMEELDYVLRNGPLYEAWIQKRELPFVIIAPQLPMYGQDEHAEYLKNRSRDEIPVRLEHGVPPRPAEFATPNPMVGALEEKNVPGTGYGPAMGWPELEHDLIGMLDHVLAHYRTDPARQYLTGLSYGGFGTWYMASRYPERFAAIVPVVGYGHPELMEPIAHAKLPIWCFAGGRDDGVKVKHFYAGLNRLEALGHDRFRFTIEADMGHDTWARVYAGNDVYDWMLAHRAAAR